MSGMAEGHDRNARGLKPRALARGVGSFLSLFLHTTINENPSDILPRQGVDWPTEE
jgi:hypothetical protein